nr:hypothetical protein BgiMline_009349 [Biomphalaria glabrata]
MYMYLHSVPVSCHSTAVPGMTLNGNLHFPDNKVPLDLLVPQPCLSTGKTPFFLRVLLLGGAEQASNALSCSYFLVEDVTCLLPLGRKLISQAFITICVIPVLSGVLVRN